MGKRSRTKGHAFEREVAAALVAATGLDHKRNLTECRDGNGGDILSPLPLAIQCKVGVRPLPFDALDEAREAAGPSDVPVAVVRRNQGGGRPRADIVVLRLEDWLRMLSDCLDAGKIRVRR